MKDYNLPAIYANIDSMLLKAQEDLEDAIKAYGDASNKYSEVFESYRRLKALTVIKLRSEGKPVTIIQDLANGECAEYKGILLKAEGKMKQCKMYVDGFTERVNMIKFMGRKTDVLAK